MTLAEAIRTPAEPILRDGTTVSDLIDRDHKEVSMRVLTDPDIYRL